ncbi:MAG: 1-deoxy-D-xylulose-5-phosphate reductoisomerase [Kiritimatiellae bacterium]|nr:1-deoxy-D-xylulose-5-phosphate reductoisomerase [Kiritimatiellia bacterium]
MLSLVLLGSTGSIGESALRVVAALPGAFRIAGLAAHSRVERLIEQAVRFGVKTVAVANEAAACRAETLAAPHGIEVLRGEAGVCRLAALDGVDMVLCALVGLAGLKPVLAAMERGRDIALATKEVLVSAGELVMRKRAESGLAILPVDSEHSAIFQSLQSSAFIPACVLPVNGEMVDRAETRIDRLLLTASGGPFAGHPEIDFERVTAEQALKHPRWSMGPKVTIDSATMMNKGWEILEARWLFNIPVDRIDVLVHPQSIVHSLVTFTDGATMAQLSPPDMRLPIQFALTWPDRLAVEMPRLDLAGLGQLTFGEPDERRFPCLRLAREAMTAGGTLPAVMNAADEIAVAAFLKGLISFAGIPRVIETVMGAHDARPCRDLETVCEADAWARRQAASAVEREA